MVAEINYGFNVVKNKGYSTIQYNISHRHWQFLNSNIGHVWFCCNNPCFRIFQDERSKENDLYSELI